MLKAAIEKIVSLAKPVTIQIGDDTYITDGAAGYDRLPKNRTTQPLAVNTLTAIRDYIVTGADENAQDTDRRFIIHIADPKNVRLGLELNSDKAREWLLTACTEPKTFPFGRWMDVEAFIVAMQQYFVPGDNVNALIKAVSSVTDSNSVQQTDDGISQTATARKGVSLEQKIVLPNPVVLAPYRTFMEIMQPESPFVFRMRGGEGGVTATLFDADGSAWQADAIESIKTYFDKEIPQELKDDVIIIA